MGKRILAVLAGVITSFILIALVQYLSSLFYPPPPGFDYKNKEAMLELIRSMPAGAWMFLILSYVTGSFGGGFVGARVADSHKIRVSLIVGVIAMAAGIMNLFQFEHPVWFAILSMLIYVPFAWLGGRLAINNSKTV
jgi:hypothetical protein